MLNGYMYNLTNPLYGEDIGMATLNCMYPPVLTGMPQTYLPGVTMYSGQPMADSYETKKQSKEKAVLKTILAGAVIAGLGFLGIKKGIIKAQKIWDSIKGFFGGKSPKPPVSPSP